MDFPTAVSLSKLRDCKQHDNASNFKAIILKEDTIIETMNDNTPPLFLSKQNPHVLIPQSILVKYYWEQNFKIYSSTNDNRVQISAN